MHCLVLPRINASVICSNGVYDQLVTITVNYNQIFTFLYNHEFSFLATNPNEIKKHACTIYVICITCTIYTVTNQMAERGSLYRTIPIVIPVFLGLQLQTCYSHAVFFQVPNASISLVTSSMSTIMVL